jgi:hypothetical protein
MLCPSRGRPAAAAELMDGWREFADFARLIVIIDEDDPEGRKYPKGDDGWMSLLPVGPSIDPGAIVRSLSQPVLFPAYATGAVGASHPGCNYLAVGLCNKCGWRDDAPRGIGPLINHVAAELCADPNLGYIGFLGDDHRPRTPHWDTLLARSLQGRPGVAYGDDGFQHERIPTACLMSAWLPRLTGHMNPPGCTHLFLDNFWASLGNAAGNLRYVPEVSIEHLHPIAGKAVWDDGWKRVNSREMQSHDHRAFVRYMEEDWPTCRNSIALALQTEFGGPYS